LVQSFVLRTVAFSCMVLRCQECARKASQYTQPCSIVEDPHPAEGVKDFGTMSRHTVSQQHAEA
jgi:hypothetical protein